VKLVMAVAQGLVHWDPKTASWHDTPRGAVRDCPCDPEVVKEQQVKAEREQKDRV